MAAHNQPHVNHGRRAADAARREAYEVCQERGHTDSGRILTSDPPWRVCKFCGTWYRHESHMVEGNVPEQIDGAPS